jgi:hypothetical protein
MNDYKKTYRPGEICPTSGLYKLLHNNDVSHEQAVIPLTKGDKFPPCRNCTQTIEWVLLEEAKS